jgi:hypothetical protein
MVRVDSNAPGSGSGVAGGSSVGSVSAHDKIALAQRLSNQRGDMRSDHVANRTPAHRRPGVFVAFGLHRASIMKASIVGGLGLLLAGCATPERFTPGERATAISPQGYTAADYEMVVEGERLGDVMVWSNGARKSEADGDRTMIHVGFHVENDSDLPIEIDPAEVEIRAKADDRVIRRSHADLVEGNRMIPPGRDGSFALYFAMPRGVSPQDLDSFRLSWTARAGDLEYTQRTPFLEHEEPMAYGPYPFATFYYSPFYDPFLFGPFMRENLIVRPVPYRHYHYSRSARRR